jgi:hypothetical protein
MFSAGGDKQFVSLLERYLFYPCENFNTTFYAVVVLMNKHRLLFDKIHFLLRGEIASELLKLLSQALADPSRSPETELKYLLHHVASLEMAATSNIHEDKQNSSREYSL